jgi:putative transposase
MKRTRFTDEQIIGILAEHDAGAKCADLCRKHGMSEGTFYNWKAKFGGMTVSEAKKALEDENAKLKKLLAEHEAGAKCADLCRKHGMSEGTFYNWKAKFGGMTVSEAKRLKALEDENAKLKKLLAEQMLDLAAMKDLVSKKW